MNYLAMSRAEWSREYEALKERYLAFCGEGLSLDLSRGKPSPEQLDLCEDMFSAVTSAADARAENGFDCRNYGEL